MRLPIRWPVAFDPEDHPADAITTRREWVEIDHDYEAVLEVLTILRLATATGARPRAALRIVARNGTGSLAQAFAAVVDQLDRGASLDEALSRAGSHEVVRRISRLLLSAEGDGSSCRRDLEALQGDLRHDRLTELEVGAQHLAVAVQFPVVLCILPAFVTLVIVPLISSVVVDLRL